MMLLVDGGGYATAESAFVGSNQVAAMAHHRLVESLDACTAGMAGDDASSAEFAASYDAAAADAVGALADLVSSLAGLGELTHASLANHRRAESRSVVAGTPIFDGGTLPDGGCVDVLPYSPPSALGADSAAIPGHVALVLDHVQEFVWPSADTSRLRLAADAWSHAAETCDDLGTYCDSAVRGLWGERSPEVPLAVDATREVRGTVRDLAAQYAALASACASYADQVDARRAEVVDLAEWLLEQFVEGVLISVALGCLTGGAGAGAGLAAAGARIAAESPRFGAIAEALLASARATSDAVRVARESVAVSRARLLKYTRVRMAMKSEAGEINLGARARDWLVRHSDAGGHTLERHVGRTRQQLLDRLATQAHLTYASSFPSEHAAARDIQRVLSRQSDKIHDWLAGVGERPMRLDDVLPHITGTSISRDGSEIAVHGIRVVLVRDSSMPEGYWIKTSFPQP